MIQATQLFKKYKNKVIFRNVNLNFKDNTISFLMGPNGVGKTTFIKCLMELENYSGTITYNNLKLTESKQKCMVIWDDCPFYSNLSGIKNLYLFSEDIISKKEIFTIALKYLNEDVLKNKVGTYSYGQKKKLALALVDIIKPEFLFMDEISNGLDYETIRNLKKKIKEWSKDMTILLTGHQFDFYNDIIECLYVFKNDTIELIDSDFVNNGKKLEEIYDTEIYTS